MVFLRRRMYTVEASVIGMWRSMYTVAASVIGMWRSMYTAKVGKGGFMGVIFFRKLIYAAIV